MQNRNAWVLLAPPLAVCRYGCASYCAAPIGVFWLAGIVSFIYGFFGGPTGEPGISYGTLLFGAILWGIAAIWAENVIRGLDRQPERCQGTPSPLCRLTGKGEEEDPLETVKKFRQEG